MTTPDDTTGKRPKPIELVARALVDQFSRDISGTLTVNVTTAAIAVFDVLTKHGCISIEGIIARDEEMGTDARKTQVALGE